jgi:hypothetical protein
MPAPFGASAIPADFAAGSIPRIVLAGEPNSGKTSLANFLLRVPVLNPDIVPNTPCPMLLRFGEAAHLRVLLPDGSSSRHSLATLHLIKRGQAKAVEVMLPLSLLRSIEILDLPGFAASGEAEANREWFALGDIQVWCAVAGQAWRASEQAKWQSLAAPRQSSIMILTHKDLLTGIQYGDLAERASHESERFFSCWTAIATPQAMAARNPRGQIVNHDAWVSTGAEDLMKKLTSLLQRVVPQGRDNPSRRAAEAAELPHPIQFFGDCRQRILSRLKNGERLEDAAAIMAGELKTYSDEVLQPWLAANSRIEPAGSGVAALIPTAGLQIMECLAPGPAGLPSFSPGDILRQIEAELADAFQAPGNAV